jgi:hypothetical protein
MDLQTETLEEIDVEGERTQVVSEDWQSVCVDTEEDHAAILKAVHRLESGILLARADSSHQCWQKIVRREVSSLIDCFESHSKASELPSGLIGLVESVRGRSELVTAVVELHRSVVEAARALLRSLTDAKTPAPFSLEASSRSPNCSCA